MARDDALALRLIGLLDLTNLEVSCGPADIDGLCRKAAGPPARVAAVCVWPQFAGDCARRLRDTGVGIATVTNFPSGGEDVDRVIDDTQEALSDGADEIDLVLPYRAFLRGEEQLASAMVRDVKSVLPDGKLLTVTLEAGAMPDIATVRRASDLAIAAGADFLKTSTGTIAVSATPQAAEAMLLAIRDAGGGAGFKAAGGIRTLQDAAFYLGLAGSILGENWASPATFRIGAGGLHTALVAAAEGGADPVTHPGY
jgi:deoxyribose-phosphate aldolase